uniref:Putative secreted protein n=1 Tax=Ixodes ricinus TaxID=34613 RepID=A0A6B0UY74_IXORI
MAASAWRRARWTAVTCCFPRRLSASSSAASSSGRTSRPGSVSFPVSRTSSWTCCWVRAVGTCVPRPGTDFTGSAVPRHPCGLSYSRCSSRHTCRSGCRAAAPGESTRGCWDSALSTLNWRVGCSLIPKTTPGVFRWTFPKCWRTRLPGCTAFHPRRASATRARTARS